VKWTLPFVFAFLFWASFHPLDLGFLAYVALVPLLVYARVASGKKAFFVAWLGGAVAFSACFFWVRHTVPAGPWLLGIIMGFYVALFVSIVRRVGALWSPVVWVAIELARGTLFGGLPWFLVGYAQHDALRLIQIADLGGVWLVSLLVAFVNGAFVDGRRGVRWAAAGAMAASFLYGAIRIETITLVDGPKIAIVQPNIPQDLKLDSLSNERVALENYRKHVELTLRAAQEKPDLIVWPEAAVYAGLLWDPKRKEWTQDEWYRRVVAPSRETEIRTLIGLLVVEREFGRRERAYTNSAVYVDGEGEISARFDKVHLVPFAEFVPFARTFPWIRDLTFKYSGLKLEDMRPGEGFPVWEVAGMRFGAQICFEAIFPEISREIARKGALFTVNISNDGWFKASGELDQMQVMARFRSIENRMQVIRATNTGISSFIEPTGRVQAILEVGGRRKEVEGILVARIRVTDAGSLCRMVGNGVGWLAVGVTAAVLAWRILVDRRKKSA
jgi:apolipoprotein N-acyltransferase